MSIHHLTIVFSFLYPSEAVAFKCINKDWNSVLNATLLVKYRDQSVLHSHMVEPWELIGSNNASWPVFGTHHNSIYMCDEFDIYVGKWKKRRNLDPFKLIHPTPYFKIHRNIATDNQGQLYILNKTKINDELQIYSKDEKLIGHIQVKSTPYRYMHVRGDLIFLLDETKIYIWKSNGSFVAEWNVPFGFQWSDYEAAVYGKELFMIHSCNFFDKDIVIYNLYGTYLRQWKTCSSTQREFQSINGIFIEKKPIVYIADATGIEAFTYSGQPLFKLPYQWDESSKRIDMFLEDPYFYIVEDMHTFRFQIEYTPKESM